MKLQLHPRVASDDPAHTLRVWAGAFATTSAPNLNWTIDGQPAQPSIARPMTSARVGDMLPDANQPRAFTGVFEFTGLAAGVPHDITASAAGETASLRAAPLPEIVPTGLDSFFNVLLVSCFHSAEDKGGLANAIVAGLPVTMRPHLTILAGDQVYLDLPTLQNFPDQVDWLADKFEEYYVNNWSQPNAYRNVLGAAPSVAMPDDHEYWNNFPHIAPQIQNSFTADGRQRWTRAAQAMYTAFQTTPPERLGDPITFDVPPLSFFFADTRTHKAFNRAASLDQNTRDKMTGWVTHVIAEGRFPVFVTGQSLFREPAGLAGNVTDFEMPNYSDFGPMMSKLAELADAGRPLLCLTGDVHWGRVTTAVDAGRFRTAMYEVISSPTSLVTTIGLDQIHRVGNVLGGLFGERDPWPRHSDADAPPTFLGSAVLGGRFICNQMHGQKGNHAALLRFRQTGGGVELRIAYWPLHKEARHNQPIELRPITLEPF